MCSCTKNLITTVVSAIITAIIIFIMVFFLGRAGAFTGKSISLFPSLPSFSSHSSSIANRSGTSGKWTYSCASGTCSIEQKLYSNGEHFGKVLLTRASTDAVWNLSVTTPADADTRKPAEIRLPNGMRMSLPWNGCKSNGCTAEHDTTANETFHLREAVSADLRYLQSAKVRIVKTIDLMGEKAAMKLAEESLAASH